jgi:hypothetical protein
VSQSVVFKEGHVTKSVSILLANIFMWVVVLATAIVLLWGMDELWMMVIAILGAGAGSHMVILNGLRHFQSMTTDPLMRM